MISYIHFALDNLYLLNGYEEIVYGEDVAYEYECVDKLEQLIRTLVLRKNKPLTGWELRFLRKGLELSQSMFGEVVGRDGQSVARWEKQQEAIPKFADIAIRLKFAERFSPSMTVKELSNCIEGQGIEYPEKLLLKITNGEWYLDSGKNAQTVHAEIENMTLVDLPRHFAAARRITSRFFVHQATANISINEIDFEDLWDVAQLSSNQGSYFASSFSPDILIGIPSNMTPTALLPAAYQRGISRRDN